MTQCLCKQCENMKAAAVCTNSILNPNCICTGVFRTPPQTSSTAPPATTFPEKVCQRFANVLPTVCIPVANVESRIPRESRGKLTSGCQRVVNVAAVARYWWPVFCQFFFGCAVQLYPICGLRSANFSLVVRCFHYL